MEKLKRYTGNNILKASPLLQEAIARAKLLIGEHESEKARQLIGGIGGGADDPTVPRIQATLSLADKIDRENRVFINKLNYFIDLLNSKNPEQIMQLFRMRLHLLVD